MSNIKDYLKSSMLSRSGKGMSHDDIFEEVVKDMEPRSKLGRDVQSVRSAGKRVLNWVDHKLGWDDQHRLAWMAARGPHTLVRCTAPVELHQTSLFTALSPRRQMQYIKDTAISPDRFWATDRRPTWRKERNKEFSTEPMFFTMYKSTITHDSTPNKNAHQTTRYFLACDEIVNYFVIKAMGKSNPGALRAFMWRQWSSGHQFNVPVEIELNLVARCIDVAILLVLYYTRGPEIMDTEVEYSDKTADESEYVVKATVYQPKFRHFEDNENALEPRARKLFNENIPIQPNLKLDEKEAQQDLLSSPYDHSEHMDHLTTMILPRAAFEFPNALTNAQGRSWVGPFVLESDKRSPLGDDDAFDAIIPVNGNSVPVAEPTHPSFRRALGLESLPETQQESEQPEHKWVRKDQVVADPKQEQMFEDYRAWKLGQADRVPQENNNNSDYMQQTTGGGPANITFD